MGTSQPSDRRMAYIHTGMNTSQTNDCRKQEIQDFHVTGRMTATCHKVEKWTGISRLTEKQTSLTL